MAKAGVGQLVAGAAAVGDGDDQTAVAQARQVVRQPGAELGGDRKAAADRLDVSYSTFTNLI